MGLVLFVKRGFALKRVRTFATIFSGLLDSKLNSNLPLRFAVEGREPCYSSKCSALYTMYTR